MSSDSCTPIGNAFPKRSEKFRNHQLSSSGGTSYVSQGLKIKSKLWTEKVDWPNIVILRRLRFWTEDPGLSFWFFWGVWDSMIKDKKFYGNFLNSDAFPCHFRLSLSCTTLGLLDGFLFQRKRERKWNPKEEEFLSCPWTQLRPWRCGKNSMVEHALTNKRKTEAVENRNRFFTFSASFILWHVSRKIEHFHRSILKINPGKPHAILALPDPSCHVFLLSKVTHFVHVTACGSFDNHTEASPEWKEGNKASQLSIIFNISRQQLLFEQNLFHQQMHPLFGFKFKTKGTKPEMKSFFVPSFKLQGKHFTVSNNEAPIFSHF